MSIRNVQTSSMALRRLSALTPSVPDNRVWTQEYYDAVYAAGPGSWSRPEWRDIGTVGPTEQKFVGLHAVFPEDGNFCSFTCAAAYTVDWGDGVVENFSSGAQANHIYNYNDVALAGTDAPVTLTDTGNLVGRTAHGFSDGMVVTLWNIAGTTGPVNGQQYYVINATLDTFQISLAPGGSAVTFTGDGTASLTRYKQAIVTVTPQAGQDLTALNLNVQHPSTTIAYNTGWLDLLIGSPNFTTAGLVIGGTETVRRNAVERVRIVNLGSMNTLANRFQNMRKLVVVELPDTAAVTTMSSMFNGCSSLQTVPLFNTGAVTTMVSMFNTCSSLQTVPLFNTGAVTTMVSMFSGCSSLQTVPLFNTAAVTTMASMFLNCSSLQTVPLFNTAAVTSMSSMFNPCSSLQTVPLFNTGAVTTMASMFNGCSSLQTVPLFNTAAVTTMGNMFSGCSSLQNVPALVTTTVTSSANFNTMFTTCNSLARIEAKDFRFTFSVANCKLSVAALDEIFTNLPTVATQQTITVTSNFGALTFSKTSSGTTAGSTTVTISNTADLVAGQEVFGTGVSDAVAVTFQDTGDTVTRTAHGLVDDTPVSFASITTTTGIVTWTTYYVVNATLNTFQVADTIGGSPRALTNNGSGTLLYGTTIVSIVPNTSVELSVPASATGSVTLIFGQAKRSIARLKNWAVTG
jgi:surface protein